MTRDKRAGVGGSGDGKYEKAESERNGGENGWGGEMHGSGSEVITVGGS